MNLTSPSLCRWMTKQFSQGVRTLRIIICLNLVNNAYLMLYTCIFFCTSHLNILGVPGVLDLLNQDAFQLKFPGFGFLVLENYSRDHLADRA